MQHDLPFTEHHIYKTPPPRPLLERLAAALPGGARELISFRGRAAKDLGLSPDPQGETDFLALIERHPRLLRRPIIVHEGEGVVGYKTAQLQDLFGL